MGNANAGNRSGRPTIKRCLVRFGMANRSNVRPARPGRDFPAHRAICRVATHRSAEDDRNSQVENSTMRLVPGASTVSVRLKNSPASRLDLAWRDENVHVVGHQGRRKHSPVPELVDRRFKGGESRMVR